MAVVLERVNESYGRDVYYALLDTSTLSYLVAPERLNKLTGIPTDLDKFFVDNNVPDDLRRSPFKHTMPRVALAPADMLSEPGLYPLFAVWEANLYGALAGLPNHGFSNEALNERQILMKGVGLTP